MTMKNIPPVSFSETGDLLRWMIDGLDFVEWPASRANAPVDFGGIMIWVKTDHRSRPSKFLSWREDSSEPAEKCGERSWKRRGLDWELALDWSTADEGCTLAVDLSLCGFSPERLYQIEYLLWIPRRENEWPEVRGQISGATQAHLLKNYGTIAEQFFDSGSAVEAVWPDGGFMRLSSSDPMSQPHYYHRGRLLKIGSTSGVTPGGEAPLRVKFVAEAGISEPRKISVGERRLPLAEVPQLPNAKGFESGLMLHLQYIGGSRALLDQWCAVARGLGYDFILIEMNRSLACHPSCPEWSWSWDDLQAFADAAAANGMRIFPGFNLLGHQNETGLLEWHPDWRETHHDCLCPSHPEVIAFASGLISRLASVCHAPMVFVGGDEVKFPSDSRPASECPRCGKSPNMDAIVRYWNELAQRAEAGTRLVLWADMFLPHGEFPSPLTANNTDGRALEYLEALDKRIILANWQYKVVETKGSVEFLRKFGHEVVLAAGQYHLENPFLHAATTRKLGLPFQLQTTWASPWPDDIPLESVAAGALAHGSTEWGPDVEKQCMKLAQSLVRALPVRG